MSEGNRVVFPSFTTIAASGFHVFVSWMSRGNKHSITLGSDAQLLSPSLISKAGVKDELQSNEARKKLVLKSQMAFHHI